MANKPTRNIASVLVYRLSLTDLIVSAMHSENSRSVTANEDAAAAANAANLKDFMLQLAD